VTGTRQRGVSAAESAAPIRVIDGSALAATGKSTMIEALAELVPSFQVQAFGTDMSNQTVQARLRGLSPNHVLVLVDGFSERLRYARCGPWFARGPAAEAGCRSGTV
jgi:iron complex outermembrane recepter protein